MTEKNLAALPRRLKQTRLDRGLTQAAVAQKIGVNKSTITRWESGRGTNHINRAVIAALADIFNVSPSYLTGLIDEPLTREAEAVARALDDARKLYKEIFDYPFSPENPLDGAVNQKILHQVRDINQACLNMANITDCISESEAGIGLKYLLAFYGIPWQDYGDTALARLIQSQLMYNFIRDSLNLFQQNLS